MVNTFINLIHLSYNKPIRLIIFNNDKLNPWFIVKDIGLALGYTKESYRNAIRDHVPDKEVLAIFINNHKNIIISLKGIIYLILRTSKFTNTIFEKWLIDTVLPSINLYGNYTAPDNTVYDF